MLVLVLVNVWQYAGMTMIIYLAGLQNISQDLYEAAMIDGAGAFARFCRITLPLLIPSIRISTATSGSVRKALRIVPKILPARVITPNRRAKDRRSCPAEKPAFPRPA